MSVLGRAFSLCPLMKTKFLTLLACLGFLAAMVSALAQTVTWDRKAYGQGPFYPPGHEGDPLYAFHYSNNNNWSQHLVLSDPNQPPVYEREPSNWSTDAYPAGVGVDVVLGNGGIGGQNAPTNLDRDVLTGTTGGLMVVNSLTIAPDGGLNVENGVNLTANLIDLQGNDINDATITLNGGGGFSVINLPPGATLKKSAGNKTYSIDHFLPVVATNAPISSTAGTLALSGSDCNYTDVTFVVGAGGVVDLVAQDQPAKFNGTFTASGAGAVRLSRGTLQAHTNTVFNMPGAIWQWVGGNIAVDPGSSFTNAGTVTIAGGVNMSSSIFTNSGTVIQSGSGNLNLPFNSGFTNTSTGIYDLQNDLPFTVNGGGGGPPPFQNAGTVRKTGGTGTTRFEHQVTFTNTGSVEAASGTMEFVDRYTQDSGSTSLHGGALTFDQEGVFNGGTLVGSGTITGTVINNGADFAPGFSPGKITIIGNYTQGANGALDIQIGGATPQTGYDQVQVSGTAALGGTLNISLINGFRPAVGQVFQFIVPGAVTGEFSTINATGFTGQVSYNAGAVTMTVASVPDIPLNISTRLKVQTGENVLIGGFIITGTAPKKVIIRGIGPSLGGAGVPDALADPTLELHQGSTTLMVNDNWRSDQEAEIVATGIPPTNDLESAIVTTLDPGPYTAILVGKNNGTGIGLIEAYDLNQAASSKLANISTRGFVNTGDNAMIGGFIIGGNGGAGGRVVVRAIGPSLGAVGIGNALQDPFLELHDANGSTLLTNDNWRSTQQAEIEATGLAPTNDLESALVTTLQDGNYTAVVRGNGDTTGVAVVEVYNIL